MLRLTQPSGQRTSIHSTLVFKQGCIIDDSKAGTNTKNTTNNPMKYRLCLPGSLEMNNLIVTLSHNQLTLPHTNLINRLEQVSILTVSSQNHSSRLSVFNCTLKNLEKGTERSHFKWSDLCWQCSLPLLCLINWCVLKNNECPRLWRLNQ